MMAIALHLLEQSKAVVLEHNVGKFAATALGQNHLCSERHPGSACFKPLLAPWSWGHTLANNAYALRNHLCVFAMFAEGIALQVYGAGMGEEAYHPSPCLPDDHCLCKLLCMVAGFVMDSSNKLRAQCRFARVQNCSMSIFQRLPHGRCLCETCLQNGTEL